MIGIKSPSNCHKEDISWQLFMYRFYDNTFHLSRLKYLSLSLFKKIEYQKITVVLSWRSALLYTQTSPYRAREILPGFLFAPRRSPDALQAQATVQPPRLSTTHRRSVLRGACERGCENLRTPSTGSAYQQTIWIGLEEGPEKVSYRASLLRALQEAGKTGGGDGCPPHQCH